MAILTVNSGSSSLKVSLFLQSERINAHFKNLSSDTPTLEINKKEIPFSKRFTIKEALIHILDTLEIKKYPLIGVGHRFVHGSSVFTESTPLSDEVINKLETLLELAPLHNPACLEAIKASKDYFRNELLQIAVFDTAFHSHMLPVASTYAINKAFGIKRFGFHGIAHAFSYEQYQKRHRSGKKVITIHLGAGCSMAAIKDGISLDTSMGFTPCEGLVMATRSGDLDPALANYLCVSQKLSLQQVTDLFNTSSGLLGLSGISGDMKTLLTLYDKNDDAKLAVDLFCYRIQKYLGAYLTVLEGADAIIFSGGIGENSPPIRSRIIEKMNWLGIALDSLQNEKITHSMHKISAAKSSVEVFVVASDENCYIKEEVCRLGNLYT